MPFSFNHIRSTVIKMLINKIILVESGPINEPILSSKKCSKNEQILIKPINISTKYVSGVEVIKLTYKCSFKVFLVQAENGLEKSI